MIVLSCIYKDSMVFCEIDDKLCEEIYRLAKEKVILDCGCGLGLLELKMKRLFPSQPIISMDIQRYANSFVKDIVYTDCLSVTPHINMIPVFIRPCHSGFVEQYITKYKSNLRFVLYIGLEENLDLDLDLLDISIDIVSDWVGADGERIYRIKCEQFCEGAGMTKYSRIFNGSMYDKEKLACLTEEEKDVQSSWYLIHDNKVINIMGGYHYLHRAEEILEIAEAESFEDLDWRKTSLNNPKEKGGWVGPDGTFYGCHNRNHGICIELVCKLSMQEAEEQGWIHLYPDLTYYTDKKITVEQLKTLSDKGCELAALTLAELDEGKQLGKDWLQASMKVKEYDGD